MQTSNSFFMYVYISKMKKMEHVMLEKHRRLWSREETIGFLRCYLARKAEFEHPMKKRMAYANVLEDMVSLSITDSERTPLCLESKMRSLLQAYKTARDNNRSTGASPCFAPYMELMDEIFGTSPIISNDHTLHVGYRSFKTVSTNVDSPPPPLLPTTTALSPLPSTLHLANSSPNSSSSSDVDSIQTTSSAALNFSPSPQVVRRKRSARELYFDEKLKLRKLEAEKKNEQRSKAFEVLQSMLKEKWQKESELEQKKVELLEKIVNRK